MSRDRFGSDTRQIISACIEVHRHLGPGLLESAYEETLAHELTERAVRFVRQPRLGLVYKGLRVEHAYQPDFIVDERVILEVKAVRALRAVHKAQLRTYVRLAGLHVGLLINFNVRVLREGIRRVVCSASGS